MHWRNPEIRDGPIPLRPHRVGLVREIPGIDDLPSLPPAVRWIVRFIQRITSGRHVAPPRRADVDRVNFHRYETGVLSSADSPRDTTR